MISDIESTEEGGKGGGVNVEAACNTPGLARRLCCQFRLRADLLAVACLPAYLRPSYRMHVTVLKWSRKLEQSRIVALRRWRGCTMRWGGGWTLPPLRSSWHRQRSSEGGKRIGLASATAPF